MYKNNLIGFFILLLLWIVLSFYFSSTIKEIDKKYIEKSELISKYNTLKEKYSKENLENEKKNILEFLNVFNITFDLTKSAKGTSQILTMELDKSNSDKIISYILNSNIEISSMKIKKIDRYTIFFEVEYK